MEERIDLKSLLPGELETLLLSMGEPKYRAKQIFQWLHRGVADLSEMSDLPKSLRAKLGERCFITAPQIYLLAPASFGPRRHHQISFWPCRRQQHRNRPYAV